MAQSLTACKLAIGMCVLPAQDSWCVSLRSTACTAYHGGHAPCSMLHPCKLMQHARTSSLLGDLIIYECAPVYKPACLPTTAERIPTTAISSSGLCTTGSVRTTRCLSTPAAWRLFTCTCTWSIPTCARQAGHAALEQQLEAACMIALVPQTSGRRTQQRGICDWRYVCGAPHFAIVIIQPQGEYHLTDRTDRIVFLQLPAIQSTLSATRVSRIVELCLFSNGVTAC